MSVVYGTTANVAIGNFRIGPSLSNWIGTSDSNLEASQVHSFIKLCQNSGPVFLRHRPSSRYCWYGSWFKNFFMWSIENWILWIGEVVIWITAVLFFWDTSKLQIQYLPFVTRYHRLLLNGIILPFLFDVWINLYKNMHRVQFSHFTAYWRRCTKSRDPEMLGPSVCVPGKCFYFCWHAVHKNCHILVSLVCI